MDNTRERPQLAKVVDHLMVQRHLSRFGFAQATGVPVATLDGYLRGSVVSIRHSSAVKMMDGLGMTATQRRTFELVAEGKSRGEIQDLLGDTADHSLLFI